MATLKELSERKEPLTGGHRACAGCGAPIIVRQILLAAKKTGRGSLRNWLFRSNHNHFSLFGLGCSVFARSF